MHRTRIALAIVVFTVACARDEATTVQTDSRTLTDEAVAAHSGKDNSSRKIAMLDDCDPSDPAWAPTGGCLLRRGDVTAAEFNALLRTPLSIPPNAQLIGHPSWRNEPSHLTIRAGKSLRIVNDGGRTHTFTEVAQFGGGRVPPLNIGLAPAPECATAINVPAGERLEIPALSAGLHLFECCIHPWMRASVRVHSGSHSD